MLAETISTAHLARLFIDGKHPRNRAADPQAMGDKFLSHTQVITCMGREEGTGKIELEDVLAVGGATPDQASIPTWNDCELKKTMEYVEGVEFLYDKAERCGYNGGIYISSPPWRILPRKLADNLSAELAPICDFA